MINIHTINNINVTYITNNIEMTEQDPIVNNTNNTEPTNRNSLHDILSKKCTDYTAWRSSMSICNHCHKSVILSYPKTICTRCNMSVNTDNIPAPKPFRDYSNK